MKSPLIKSLVAISPKFIINNESNSSSKFEKLLQILYDANLVFSSTVEKAKTEFVLFRSNFICELRKFSDESRLDVLYYNLVGLDKDFTNLWCVLKLVLIMSHGNADVEPGFSMNKNLLVENLQEKTIISWRIVYDAIRACGGVLNVQVSDTMRMYAKHSCFNYRKALADKKRKENDESELEKLKRKAKSEILQLEIKKRKIPENNKHETDDLERKINVLRKYI